MQLYLIRHGQSHVNLPDWTGGNTDKPLTTLGRQQAEALADWLPARLTHIDMLYASTMRRARETAEPLAHAYQVAINFDDRVREIGNNRIDHTAYTTAELPLQYVDFWASARPFAPVMVGTPEAESLMHFRTRVGLFIEELVLKHRGKTVVVVCHGGVVEFAFDHIFNIGPWRRCEVWCYNTGVTHFEYVEHPGREVWRLHRHNRVDHLTALTR